MSFSSSVLLASDHPHSRGKETGEDRPLVKEYGSPPLAWGRVATQLAVAGTGRITPTRVGKRRAFAESAACDADHPHSRGEERDVDQGEGLLVGSPPLAWGRDRQ